MNLSKRLKRLENRVRPKDLPPLNIEIISHSNQLDHPERFDKVLDSEEISESGLVRRTYRFIRKES